MSGVTAGDNNGGCVAGFQEASGGFGYEEKCDEMELSGYANVVDVDICHRLQCYEGYCFVNNVVERTATRGHIREIAFRGVTRYHHGRYHACIRLFDRIGKRVSGS